MERGKDVVPEKNGAAHVLSADWIAKIIRLVFRDFLMFKAPLNL